MTIKYTSLDFNSIKQDIINKLTTSDSFKDYNFTGSYINTLIELIAGVGDLFSYYANMVANESFIQTAELYENVNKLAELVGYKPSGYKSAVTTINLNTLVGTYDLTNKNNYKISIPKFTIFTCSETTEAGDSIYFINTDDIVYIINTASLSAPLSAQSLAIEVPVIQGNPVSVGNELVYTATGEIFQKYNILDGSALTSNVTVTIDNVEWVYVDSLYTGTDGTSKVFTTRYNKEEKVEVKFGDGIYGAVPPISSTIKIRYVSSLGSNGNINTGIINGIQSSIYETDTSGNTITLPNSNFTVSQNEVAIGGSEPQTTDEIRNYVSAFSRTQNRVVTKQDYEDLLISSFGQFIYKAKVLNHSEVFTNDLQKFSVRLTSSQLSTLNDALSAVGYTPTERSTILYSPTPSDKLVYYNNVYILLVPKYGSYITDTLKDQIDTYLSSYKMVVTNHLYLDPEYIPINVTINYKKITGTNRTTAEIEMDLRNIILNFFSKSERDLGELLIHSDLVDLLNNVSGVKTIILGLQRNDVITTNTNVNIQLDGIEFPILGTLTITA